MLQVVCAHVHDVVVMTEDFFLSVAYEYVSAVGKEFGST